MKFLYAAKPLFCLILVAATLFAQVQSVSVPPLINYAGVLDDQSGKPRTGSVTLIFSIYSEPDSTTPLWQETQTATLDSQGRYGVQLGSVAPAGLPIKLFTSGKTLWLGVQPANGIEQPRVALVSVPYAIKAADADTLGGRPASSYVTRDAPAALLTPEMLQSAATATAAAQTNSQSQTTTVKPAIAGTGTANYIPLWTDSLGDLGNSSIFQATNGNIGIGTTNPANAQLVISANQASILAHNWLVFDNQAAGYGDWKMMKTNLNDLAFAFDVDHGMSTNYALDLQYGGNVGINTINPTATLEVNGTAKFDGLVTFAPNQTFPGAGGSGGTVTATTGGGLALTGSSIGLLNTCSAGQVLSWSGSAWQCSAAVVSNTSVGTVQLGGKSVSGSLPALGPNLLANGNFATGDCTDWTCGAGWAVSGTQIAHTAGNTAPLSQTITVNPSTVYTISFTQTGANYGSSVTYAIGSQSMTIPINEQVWNGATIVNSTQSGAVTFSVTPSSDYTGSLTNIAVQATTAGNPVAQVLNANGTVGWSVSTGTNGNNLFMGNSSGEYNTTGFDNIALGTQALNYLTGGWNNIAIGVQALSNVTMASKNTAVGVAALKSDTTGSEDTAVGSTSLYSNTTGIELVAIGQSALYANTTGSNNVGVGVDAISANTTGFGNVGMGTGVLYSANGTNYNTAMGDAALHTVTGTGSLNTVMGSAGMYNLTTGYNNAAIGSSVGYYTTTGSDNVFLGAAAGNTANTANANVTGSNNVFAGYNSGPDSPTQVNNATAIGANTLVHASNTTVIGNASVTDTYFGSTSAASAVHAAGGTFNGNVGIGTATPGATLEVNGTAKFDGLATFVAGQTFPGTVSAATPGGGLAVNGTTVGLTTGCGTGQVLSWSGSAWQCASVGLASGSNTAVGSTSLLSDTTGLQLVAIGHSALYANTTGSNNVGVGVLAIGANTSGSGNVAVGTDALYNSDVTNYNTAIGDNALHNTFGAGSLNTVLGSSAMFSNTTGYNNAALGSSVGYYNTTGSYNVFLGMGAGDTANTANANVTGSNNLFAGYNSGPDSPTQLNNAMAVGANTLVHASNTTVIGNANVTDTYFGSTSAASAVHAAAGTFSGNVGIGTTTPGANLEVNGTAKFDGLATFATGQTFPGTLSTATAGGGLSVNGTAVGLLTTCGSGQVLSWSGNAWVCSSISSGGTITGVVAGTDLTGGGTAGAITLNIDTTKVPQLTTTNAFTSNQTVASAAAGVIGLQVQTTDTTTTNTAISGYSAAPGGMGVVGEADTSSSSVGVMGTSANGIAGQFTSTSGIAGQFNGNVNVTGNISKAGGSFKIDHPLDPENKYLYHSFVESPDMKNIYDGVAILDANGESVIQLPDWFSALNRDFRYQLTCIGGFAPVYISKEMANNTFSISGGKAGMKISWQVTGIRQDPWANANRIPVEQQKPTQERGSYLHPELYGASSSKNVVNVNHQGQKGTAAASK